MALPEQLRRQLEQVDQFLNKKPDDATAPSTPDATAAPPTDATAQPVEVPAQLTAAPVESVQPVSDDWQAKYNTLQGKYNAEVPRLQHTVRELSAQVQSFQQLLANMNQSQAGKAPAATQPVQKLVSEKDVEAYGADTIDLVRRVVREEVAPVMMNVKDQLAQVGNQFVNQVQQVSSRQAMSNDEMFFMRLDQTFPNWKDINANTGFHSWLLEVDPLTGIARQSYLDDARRSLDVPRVVAIFKEWANKGGVPVSSAAAPKINPPVNELEKQIAPGKSRSEAAPVQSSQKRTYTPSDISKFYDDVLRGKYKTRRQEQDQIERDIFEAQRENRVIRA